MQHRPLRARSLLPAGLVLGMGFGGFLDGLLFHQVLGWHHLLTSSPDPALRESLRANELADGLFHLGTWGLLAVGLLLLWRARDAFAALGAGRRFLGALLLGAGAFNLLEGLVNHQILGIHHVHPTEALGWDLAYLAVGALLVVAGLLLWRTADRVAADRRGPSGEAGRPGWRSG
ncbi:MAG TPA: DUF2243 domain-containing protein [Candidatus Thermoplasmatota archaeon]|nr:DUF2243 domain-containing protein [Candidatus Thermoplasmatota archaeon]